MLRPGGLLVLLRPGRLLPSFPGPGSPRTPGRLSLDGFIVICHHRSFTGWTGSLMGCELTGDQTASWKLDAAGLLRLAGVAGENLGVLFDASGRDATAVCFYELTRLHGSCRDTSTNLALDFNVVLDQELDGTDFAVAFAAPLAAKPKKLREILALTGGPSGGDWKWGQSGLQIG